MSKQKFKVSSDELFDVSVTIEVDSEILTIEHATSINNFFTDHTDRLDDADGDVLLAVIKFAGRHFLYDVMDANKRYSERRMNSEFWESEGWGGYEYCGIKLVDYEGRPDFDTYNTTVERISD